MLVVAIDHGTSFSRYMSNWGFESRDAADVKDAIGRLALRVGADAVVLDAQGIAMSRSWAQPACETWIGGPDVAFPELHDVACRLLAIVRAASTPESILPTVKIGALVGAGVSMAGVATAVSHLDELSAAGSRVILEPIFGKAVTDAQRRTLLSHMASISGHLYLKCDFGPGEGWLEGLGTHFPDRWFLRSSGAQFDHFLDMFRRVQPHRALGVIAGTALWGDLGRGIALAEDGAAEEFGKRLEALRAVEIAKDPVS